MNPSIGIEQWFIPFWSIRQTQPLSGGTMDIIACSFKLFHAPLLMTSKREFLRKIACLIRSLIHLESNKYKHDTYLCDLNHVRSKPIQFHSLESCKVACFHSKSIIQDNLNPRINSPQKCLSLWRKNVCHGLNLWDHLVTKVTIWIPDIPFLFNLVLTPVHLQNV